MNAENEIRTVEGVAKVDLKNLSVIDFREVKRLSQLLSDASPAPATASTDRPCTPFLEVATA